MNLDMNYPPILENEVQLFTFDSPAGSGISPAFVTELAGCRKGYFLPGLSTGSDFTGRPFSLASCKT